MKTILPILALMLLSQAALGQDPPRRWSVHVQPIYEWLPGSRRPTGGPGLAASVHYAVIKADAFEAAIGASGRSFAWANGWYWTAIWGGPEGSIIWKPGGKALGLSATIALDMGQHPECTEWANTPGQWCLRFWGVHPRADLGLSCLPGWGEVGVVVGGRYTSTLIHQDALSLHVGAMGAVRF